MFKRFISLFLFLIVFSTTEQAFGQDLLEVLPTTKEEFIASEKRVLATIAWLEKMPIDKEVEKKKLTKSIVNYMDNECTNGYFRNQYKLINFYKGKSRHDCVLYGWMEEILFAK